MCDKTDWMKKRKWGLFSHYLESYVAGCGLHSKCRPELSWNDCVDCFDVQAYALTAHELNAGYVVLTVMQASSFLCAPNRTYDRIAGSKPGEACSKRDLPEELADALAAYGIPLMLYFTGDGPYLDEKAGDAFGYRDRESEWIREDFVIKWAAVLEEYAVRYGRKVKGWWIDGCYTYLGYHDGLLKHYKDAARRGNPDAVIAFNNGVIQMDLERPELKELYQGETHPFKRVRMLEKAAAGGNQSACQAFENKDIVRYSRYDDFTAGEQNEFTQIPKNEDCPGIQWHILSFLGIPSQTVPLWGTSAWGAPGSKYSGGELLDYVKRVNERGGVVTIDVCTFRDGSIDPAQIEVLNNLKALNG